MSANISGSVWAAQPVTTMRASGPLAPQPRMAWRAWRTASAVTAQVLKTTASLSPAASVSRDHLGLVGVEAAAEGDDIDIMGAQGAATANNAGSNGLIFEFDRTGHQDMVVRSRHSMRGSPPGSVTFAMRSVRRSRAAATAAAQAAEPQALVRPAPRSQVRIAM